MNLNDIKNTILLCLSNNMIIVRNRDTNITICKNNELNTIWENCLLNGSCYELLSNKLAFTTNKEISIINGKDGNLETSFPWYYLNHQNNIIVGKNKIDKKTIAYDYIMHKICWENKFVFSTINIYDNYLIGRCVDENFSFTPIIYCNKFKSGTELWQFSISDFPPYINGFGRKQEADIKQITGVYNNLLWVHVGGFRLIGIDINSGKQVHCIEDVLKGGEENNFLDTQKGILKTLGYDYYAEFDLQTLQFRKQVQIDCKEDIKIRNSNFYEGDKYLYFSGYYNKCHLPNVFGIFDTEKTEIIWYETKKDDWGYFYNPPQANDKLLAVLDDKHNLLVYERE